MGWIAFAILTFLGVVLQTSVVPYLNVRGIYPDLMIAIAIFYILCAPRLDAMIAAWFLGLATDLASHGQIGPMAFGYGLVALATVQIRRGLVRDHPVTHIFVTLPAAWVIQVWGRTYDAICYSTGPMFSTGRCVEGLYAAALTTAAAPYVIWLLIQMRGLLGMTTGFRHLRPRGGRRRFP